MNPIATAIVTASMICSGSVLQANIISPQLGGYSYGGSGGYGPQTYQKVSPIGCGGRSCGASVLQGPAATASITRSAAAVSVPVRCRYPLVNLQFNPYPFYSGYSGAGRLVEGAALKKNELLDRLLLRRSQKLVNCRAAELQHSQPVQLQPQMFVGPACYS